MSTRSALQGRHGNHPGRLPSGLYANHAVRAYRLTIRREGGDGFGISVEETFSGEGRTLTAPLVAASRAQTTRILDAVVQAVKASGHPASVLAFQDDVPVSLGEAQGVRLALTLFATMPVTKSERIRSIVAGINAMSVEEVYYWYSKCMGREGARARKALRTLLSDG